MKMVNIYLDLSSFTVFLKNRNIFSKIRRSKVADYVALTLLQDILMTDPYFEQMVSQIYHTENKLHKANYFDTEKVGKYDQEM